MSLKWLDTGAQLISRTVELGSQLVFFSPFKKIEVQFPSGSVVKKKKKKKIYMPVQKLQDTQIWSPGQEDSPGGGNGNPFQYSCLENPMDRGAWRATVHGGHK